MNHICGTTRAMRIHRRLTTLAAISLAAALTACGGGGGDGGGGRPYTAPAQAPTTPGSLTNRVLSANDGQPVPGATVSFDGTTATTDTNGSLSTNNLTQVDRLPIAISAPGYAPTMRIASVSNNVVTVVPTQLLPIAATVSIDAATGGTASVPGSTAQVTFPAGAIVTAGGAAPTQPVLVQLTPINPALDPNLMPGDYRTTNAGAAAWLESYGALTVVLTDAAGGSYNLAAGQSATIRIPAATRASTMPATIPLYWFNESSGLWVQEGSATLGGTAPNSYYEGSVTHFTTWNADDRIDTVQVTGCVRDVNNIPVSRARVEVDGVTYSGMSNVLTDSFGNFSVPMRQNASAAVTARSGLRVSNTRAATATTNNVALGSPCLILSDGAISIRLTWGQSPLDVDSHLLTPQGAHVYYLNKGSLTAAPYANLDIDDITSYGPEIVTISRLARGTYRYYLNNFSNTFSPGMTASPVRVEVTYDGNTTIYTPGPGEGTFVNWHAFDIVVDAQCAVSITPADTWSATDPANPNQTGGAVTYCN